ncbi:MAG: GNAT family N-acetyltransferase, partial [Ideonella sp.]
RAGMLRVDSLQDLFMAAETLARFGSNRDTSLTVMTNGGGAGVMAADAAAQADISLSDLSDALRARLDAVLPATWSRNNPIDIIGDAPVQRYTDTLEAVLADPSSGAVLFIHAPTAIVRSEDIANACAPMVRQSTDRILACWLGEASVAAARKVFEEAGAANYETPEEAVRAFALLATYRHNQTLMLEAPTASENGPPDLPTAQKIIAKVLAQGREMLDELEAKAVLKAYGIPVVESLECAGNAAAASSAAQQIGYPVVLKILSPDISHKSDVGGVALNLRDEQALQAAVHQMLERVTAARPEARIDGFSVQSMASRPHAQELIAGASIDPVFGPVILFGQGGIAVEVLADRAIALPPLNRMLAKDLISRTRVARLLAGYRDRQPAQLDSIADVLIGISQMLADLPEMIELDINPLLADDAGVLALDARIRVGRQSGGGAANFSITPYPSELVEQVAWQGQTIVLRPIRPEDGPQHRSFAQQLGADDLRLRFFSTRRYLPPSELARLTQIDYAREMAFIAVRPLADGTGEETLGVVRGVSDPDNVEAEFAVIVRSDLKGMGLGRLLMNKLIAYLKGHGTRRVVGHVLQDNESMRSMVRGFGFQTQDRDLSDDSSVWTLELTASNDS